ncbi:calcium-binding protein [Gemmobacter serpentinus]|uniref:calcium-binding protein n=1 Tax=Gemmobacter serpentinus TaxID=2652247 RepID=UPI00124E2798|nr:calcium-binding protein [Gemmobacter serpentinus]
MTTHTLTGIQVTFSGATATATALQTLKLVTTEKFSFSYRLTAPSETALSAATIKATYGTAMHSVTLGSTRITLDGNTKVGQYTWGEGKSALIMEVTTSATSKSYFVLDGTALPSFATISAYNAFMAALTGTTSVSRKFDVRGPNLPIDPKKVPSFTASTEDDVITGNTAFGDNFTKTIFTGTGNDNVTGLATNDKIDAGAGNDTVNGLAGNDSIDGKAGNDSLLGGDGDDTVLGNVGDDTIFGGNGNDSIKGGTGNDNLSGDAGNDKILGEAGNDNINGGAGSDHLVGGGGNDTLVGGADNDSIFGGNDNDSITGDAGDDLLRGERGADTIDGGTGEDKIDGGYGDDVLRGGADNDTINGNIGNDLINGDGGNDSILGGDGKDTITGGAGNDTIKGGSGADVFVFADGHGADRILDFKDNVDTLQFTAGLAGNSVAAALNNAEQAGRNVVFDFGDGDTLVIMNITKAKLLNDIDII